jgi:ribosomal protein S8
MHTNLINNIKLNLKYKKKMIRLNLNRYEISIINILIKINIIKFIKKNKNKFDIYLNYFNNKPIFQNITNISKSSKYVYVSYNIVKYITNKYKIIFIINTNKGVITNFEAVKCKTGGILIAQIWN